MLFMFNRHAGDDSNCLTILKEFMDSKTEGKLAVDCVCLKCFLKNVNVI